MVVLLDQNGSYNTAIWCRLPITVAQPQMEITGKLPSGVSGMMYKLFMEILDYDYCA